MKSAHRRALTGAFVLFTATMAATLAGSNASAQDLGEDPSACSNTNCSSSSACTYLASSKCTLMPLPEDTTRTSCQVNDC